MKKKMGLGAVVAEKENKTSYEANITYPIREILEKELKIPRKCEECIENVTYGRHTYRIKRKDGRDVMIVPLANNEKMVDVPINISDEDFLYLAKEAHRRDVTFNQLVTILLSRHIDKQEEAKSKTKKRK